MGNLVSSRKNNKQQQRIFDNFFELLSTSVLLVNRQGTVLKCNKNSSSLLGYPKEKL